MAGDAGVRDWTAVKLGFFRVRPSTTGHEHYGALFIVNGALEPVELCVTMVDTKHLSLWGTTDHNERICAALLRDAIRTVQTRPDVVIVHGDEVPQGALDTAVPAGMDACRTAPGGVAVEPGSGTAVDESLLPYGITLAWHRRVPPADSLPATIVRSHAVSGALHEPFERAWLGLNEAFQAKTQ